MILNKMEPISSFLIKNSGVTLKSAIELRYGRKPILFQPYKSKSDPFYRAGTIITDPIYETVLALTCALNAIVCAFKSLVDLTMSNSSAAKFRINESFDSAVGALLMTVVAFTSPIINLIDLIGGGIASLSQKASGTSFHR